MKKASITFGKIVLFVVGWAVLAEVIGEGAGISNGDLAIWRFWWELIPCLTVVIFTILFLLMEKREIRIPIMDNIGTGTFIGCLIGFLWIGAPTVLLMVSRQLSLVGKNAVRSWWLWMASAFINVITQELLVRGYVYQLLKKKCNLMVSMIVTTALFTLAHGGALEAGVIPVINVITMCLFTTALYESEKTLLAPIMAHTVWNIIGGLLLGVVSLADDYPSLWSTTASGNELLSGGAYKIEASIIVTVLNVGLMVLFYMRYRKGKSVKQ